MLETTHINPALSPFGEQFSQQEPDSITEEEAAFLYGLVRMRKPTLAIETGTGHGVGSQAISCALAANNKGKLITCDTDPDYISELSSKIWYYRFVDVRHATGLEILSRIGEQKPEFIFVDAGDVNNRMEELHFIVDADCLAPKGLLAIHDAMNGKYKALPEYIRGLGWPGFALDSLAGIAVFQKP